MGRRSMIYVLGEEDHMLNTSQLLIVARVPIADIFQTKRRRRRDVNSTDYEDEGDDYDFWGGEYDEYSQETEIVATKERINFNKYGAKNGNKDTALETVDGLPDNIYCDLVTTLNEKCVLTNLQTC